MIWNLTLWSDYLAISINDDSYLFIVEWENREFNLVFVYLLTLSICSQMKNSEYIHLFWVMLPHKEEFCFGSWFWRCKVQVQYGFFLLAQFKGSTLWGKRQGTCFCLSFIKLSRFSHEGPTLMTLSNLNHFPEKLPPTTVVRLCPLCYYC
jgi:hypothetical protein